MTIKTLTDIKALLIGGTDRSVLSTAETLSALDDIEQAIHKQQLIDFKQHMADSHKLTATEIGMDTFCNMQWTITYGDKSITVGNQAAVHNNIECMIDELLDEL